VIVRGGLVRRVIDGVEHWVLDYLPPVARRLHHSRDLGEPFDFITLFEYAPDYAPMFDQMVARLRATHEWTFIDREVDIRLERMYDVSATS
jgi:hypothetical protein